MTKSSDQKYLVKEIAGKTVDELAEEPFPIIEDDETTMMQNLLILYDLVNPYDKIPKKK